MNLSSSSLKVISVNISTEKGTVKKPVENIQLTHEGIINDAHAGSWHRMVSLLGTESFRKFEKEAGRPLAYGEFAENITTEGIILHETAPFDRFQIGDVLLEVTQIGKKCHGSSCAIFKEVGNCVMPKEGIFARVLNEGVLKPGDKGIYLQKTFKVMVITLSDRASKGTYEDLSGPALADELFPFFGMNNWHYSLDRQLIPDNKDQLSALLQKAKMESYDMVFTTGGTGIGLRDITPDVVKAHLDVEIPGIMEQIRHKYGSKKPQALLSRSIAGRMGETLVYALPGSKKAIKEYMSEILLTLRHLLFMLKGIDIH
ncbi:MAG: molybdopterin-binding protein [Bacteroidetes bacterium]|jgi:molybdopterin adenylyltransferase|nr:molybdopterin-binding protein [Bacteroidota bacterium]